MRTEENADRWRARVGLSAFVSAAVFLVPVLLAIATSVVVAHIVPEPRAGTALVAWWVLLLAVPGVVYVVASRLGRRALPLAALLKMTLVFPDKAPSRMVVARRAGSTRGLERQLAAARDSGVQDEPAVAAEQILALAASLNMHDRLTRGHSERVRVVTDLVANQLKLPEEDRDRLRWSALLHDIGKLTVDGSILNKPGKPDEAEWRILQGHPLEGARLAAPLAAWLGPWADTIAQHHEKFDGTGYPFGLSGEQISLGGRIVAVADCYETMTAVRSYKAAMTAEAARKELAACAGTHFDPVIVRAFLEASVGRFNLLGGPLSWLGEIPLLNSLPRLGQLATTAGQAFAGAIAITGVSVAVVHGAHHAVPSHPAPVAAGVRPTKVAAGATVTPPAGTTLSLPPLGSHLDPGGPQATDPSPPTSTPAPAGDPVQPSGPLTPAALPSAPLSVNGVAGDGQVVLSWTPPAQDGGDPVTAYSVTPYIGFIAQPVTTFTSPATTETITGLTDGTAYTFEVSATTDAGTGPDSADSAPVTPATVPGAPSGASATAGNGSATVTWTAPSFDGGNPISGYTVVSSDSTTPANGAESCIWTAGPLTCTVSGLTNGDAYTFTVSATNSVGVGVASSPSNTVTPATVPDPPTIVSATPGNASATVTWTAPPSDGGSAITAYTVVAGDETTPANGGESCIWTAGPLTCTVGGLTNGDAYIFAMSATNEVGDSATSALFGPLTPAALPSAPLSVNGVAGDGQVVLSWTPPAQDGGDPVTAYSVTPYIGFIAQPVTTFTSPATTETITGLTDGTAYTFEVSATTDAGTGPDSADSAPVTPATVPGAPSGASATAGNGSATVTWTAPSFDGGNPISGYTVVSSDSTTPANGGESCTWTAGPLTCTVSGLTNGDAYTFTVSATNSVGVGVASSPSNTVTPATVPDPPTIVSATPGNASATVTWTAPPSDGGSAITAYTVVAGDETTPANGGESCIWTAGPLTCTVGGLTNGDAYIFAMSATNEVGDSATSALFGPLTPAALPSAPLSVNGVAGDGQVVLSWTPPAQDGGDPVTAYSVTPYIGFIAQPVTTFTSPATTETITGLTDGTAYTFEVSATTDAGTGPDSADSAPVTPEPPPPNPPTGLTATPSCQLVIVGPEVAISWTASTSPSVTSYVILRGSTAGGLSALTSVSSGTTSYTDTSVTGFSTTYWYEVEAVGPGGTADSNEISSTTPPLCV